MEAILLWMNSVQPGSTPPATFYNIYPSRAEAADALNAKYEEEDEYALSRDPTSSGVPKPPIRFPDAYVGGEPYYAPPPAPAAPPPPPPPPEYRRPQLHQVHHGGSRLPITGHSTSAHSHNVPPYYSKELVDDSTEEDVDRPLKYDNVDIVVKFNVVPGSTQFVPSNYTSSDRARFQGIDRNGNANWLWNNTGSNNHGAVCYNYGAFKREMDLRDHRWHAETHNLVPLLTGACNVDDPRNSNVYLFTWTTSLIIGEWRKAGGTWRLTQTAAQNKELPRRSLEGEQLKLYPKEIEFGDKLEPRVPHMPPQARAAGHFFGLIG